MRIHIQHFKNVEIWSSWLSLKLHKNAQNRLDYCVIFNRLKLFESVFLRSNKNRKMAIKEIFEVV
jgi:hypothetical protein